MYRTYEPKYASGCNVKDNNFGHIKTSFKTIFVIDFSHRLHLSQNKKKTTIEVRLFYILIMDEKVLVLCEK